MNFEIGNESAYPGEKLGLNNREQRKKRPPVLDIAISAKLTLGLNICIYSYLDKNLL